MQIHEQFIVRSRVVTQEMAQYINALIRDNQNKSMRIEKLVRESQVHAEILRQHQICQEVIAEVMKCMMAGNHQGQQQPQPQGVSGTSPIVTDVDEKSGSDPYFPSAPSPNSGPPSGGTWGMGMELIHAPESMEIVERP